MMALRCFAIWYRNVEYILSPLLSNLQSLLPLAMQVAYSSRVHAERLCITLPNACNQG